MYPVADKEQRWELLKQYIRHGYIDTDTHLLGEYAEALDLSVPSRISLAFLYSTCYNVPTACFLHKLLGPIKDWERNQLQAYWDEYKQGMIFQTDRKWVKIANQFVDLCMDFKERMHPYSTHLKPYTHSFDAMYNAFSQLKNQGRVATYIFIDGLIAVGVMEPCAPERFDWNNGHTCTEGMLHALGMDEMVEYFDKGKHRLSPKAISHLDYKLLQLMTELRDEGLPEDYVCDYESNLCAYRKYFKGTMYNGYYIDRQLEELRKLQKHIPSWGNLWEYLFQLRKAVYPSSMLGEVSGWSGIRKERMKNFLENGVMDVDY